MPVGEDFSKQPIRNRLTQTIAFGTFALVILMVTAWQGRAEDIGASYLKMAPIEQYRMKRNGEIALARSAAPDSISREADVMVLGQNGYETAFKDKNGFVCLVERSWAGGIDDPEFWNPKLRGPICFNPPAVRSYLPVMFKKTGLALAGRSKAQIFASIKTAFDKKELPTPELGAMCYMMSKQGYLGDHNGHWHPHLMFFTPLTDVTAWGAGLPGSPIIGIENAPDRMTVFMIPVGKWSDGTVDAPM
jgi:hypothetical protein